LLFFGLVSSTFGAPQNYGWLGYPTSFQQYQNIPSQQYGQSFNNPYQSFQVGRSVNAPFQRTQNNPSNLWWNGNSFINNPYENAQTFNNPSQAFQPGRAVGTPFQPTQNVQADEPLGITVDFDSSFGSFPLSVYNQLTRAQRNTLLPVMESLLRVLETSKPSVRDVNTLMIQVRDLLKTIPEGEVLNLRQFGFDTDSIPFGLDLDMLKNVALPKTGDIAITENGQDKIVTAFGKFPLESLMTDAEREQFLPAVRGFINLLRKDVLDPTETVELLGHVRKLDSWNLFPFDVRRSNEPRKKMGSGSTFNIGALSGLISGLVNAQNSGRFF